MPGSMGAMDLPSKVSGRGSRPGSIFEMEGRRELGTAIDGDEVLRMRAAHRTRPAGMVNRCAVGTKRRNIALRNAPDGGVGIPAVSIEAVAAVAGNPNPAVAVEEVPCAAVIGPPAPGVAGNPAIPDAAVIAPGADAKGIPGGGDAGGRPDLAVAGQVIPAAVVVEVVPGGVVRIAGTGAGGGLVGFELGEGLIAVGVPLIPGIGRDVLGDGEFTGLLGIGLEGLAGMNVEGEALAVIDMDSTVHDGELWRGGIEGDAEDGTLHGGGGVAAEVDAVLATAAVEFVVAEAGEGVDLGDGAAVGVAAELGEADGAVGGEAGDAAIFKLDFEAAVVAGDEAHALDGGHVGLGLIEGDLIALENLDLAFDVADADGANLALPLGFRRGAAC